MINQVTIWAGEAAEYETTKDVACMKILFVTTEL